MEIKTITLIMQLMLAPTTDPTTTHQEMPSEEECLKAAAVELAKAHEGLTVASCAVWIGSDEEDHK